MVYQSIEYFVNLNKKVGFAIPRKDVVIEIYDRLKKDYKDIKVISVYGNHNDIIDGQLIVLTTHQLFRYKNYFDLLILDEADAFPYYKNDLLNSFLKNSCKGPIVYLSATIRNEYLKICKNIVYVNRRFHNDDLPVPIFKKYYYFNKIKVLKDTLQSLKNKQILIFVPTIEIGKKLSSKLNISFIYSSFNKKEQIIEKFKNNLIKILITTTILERGMTFYDVQVIVFEANHILFDKSSLVQIAGRVGRKINATKGKIYFLSTCKSECIKQCIKTIKEKNKTIA